MKTPFENKSPKNGERLIGFSMKMPGSEGGWMIARIYSEYRPETGTRVYIARDFNGQMVLPPTTNLSQLRKDLKANSRELSEFDLPSFTQKEKGIEQTERTKQT